MPFTDKQIAALKAKPARYEKTEPGRTGLRIRVSPRGTTAWGWVYRFDGATRRVFFGRYPDMGIADAHEALAQAKKKLERGIDPGAEVAAERQAERDAETVGELVAEYLERHVKARMKASSAAEVERLLTREVLPHWRNRKAKEIRARTVITLLDAIADRGAPVQRNRVASSLNGLFRFAVHRGILDQSPAYEIERLPETTRDRFLSPEEIHALWTNLALPDLEMTPGVALALKFALVTGQRRAEVAGILRPEIDDRERLWRVPAERSKNGRGSIVPLPPLAMSIVAEADALRVRPFPVRPNRKDRAPYDPSPSPFLFPSTRLGKPIEPAAITRALNRNRLALAIGEEPTVHDLRRSFATWHGELGTAPEILSALMNHAPQNITAAVYNRATNLEPRRRAMEIWCSWLERVIAGEKVDENVILLERRL